MILKNAKIVIEDEIIDNGWIEIKDDKIKSVNRGTTDQQGIDLQGKWVLPGFIDCHVHGGYGVDFESGSVEAFQKFAKNVAKEGVTKYYQGSVTNSVDKNDKVYKVFGDFMKNGNNVGAKCMGAHMEGPFISPDKKGAHDPKLLIKPSIELTDKWNKLSGGNLKLVTYATELQDGSYTKWLIKNNILPVAGHSNVSYEDFERDYRLGVRHVTHLYNQMSEAAHNAPGLAAFALNHEDIKTELITDGVHVKPEVLQLTWKVKGADDIIIITDAMQAKGLPDGDYMIGDLPCYKKGIEVRLKSNNALAGAGATYDHNVRFFKETCGVNMTDLIKMTSMNIAKQMGIFDQTGSIAANKLADIVVLDDKLKVNMTICEGKVAFNINEH